MIRQLLTGAAAVAFALATSLLGGSAQSDTPVNADGAYVVANDDGSPMVSGKGDDVIYGDINTGGGGGQVLGDPTAVYTPVTPDHDTVALNPGAGDGMIGGMPIRPVATAPDNTATTTTSLDNSTGATSENVPVESMGESTSTSTDAAPVGFCAQYVDWYDAQVAYEDLGATAADPALVNEVDPDWDGIACEVEMS
ncbi:MAG: hypothetical protein JNM64_03600 [Chloroflexia bacterium]|nr:hypothetical protein [Chloroflexia bacterium]